MQRCGCNLEQLKLFQAEVGEVATLLRFRQDPLALRCPHGKQAEEHPGNQGISAGHNRN